MNPTDGTRPQSSKSLSRPAAERRIIPARRARKFYRDTPISQRPWSVMPSRYAQLDEFEPQLGELDMNADEADALLVDCEGHLDAPLRDAIRLAQYRVPRKTLTTGALSPDWLSHKLDPQARRFSNVGASKMDAGMHQDMTAYAERFRIERRRKIKRAVAHYALLNAGLKANEK